MLITRKLSLLGSIKLSRFFNRFTNPIRNNLLNHGLLNLLVYLRWVLWGAILVRCNLFKPPADFKDSLRFDLLATSFYGLYLAGLTFLMLKRSRVFNLNVSKVMQALLDIGFISVIYYLRGDVRSDIFYCYFIPLLLAFRYLKSWQLNLMVGLIVLAVFSVCYLAVLAEDGSIWEALFIVPSRFILLLSLPALSYIFGDYLRLMKVFSRLAKMEGAGLLEDKADMHAKLNKIVRQGYWGQGFERWIEPIISRLNQVSDENYNQALYQEVIKIAQEDLACETVAIFMFQTGLVKRIKADGLTQRYLGEENYQPGQGLTGQVFGPARDGKFSRRIVRENNLSRTQGLVNEFVKAYSQFLPSKQLRHFLVVPIFAGDVLVGAVRVMNKLERAGSSVLDPAGFSDKDVAILSIIADLVGTGLYKHNLTCHLQELSQAVSTLAGLTLKTELYQYFKEETARVLEAEDCTIYALDEQNSLLELVASKIIPLDDFGDHWRIKPEDRKRAGLVAWVAAAKTPLLLTGKEYKQHQAYRESGSYYRYLRTEDCHSVMVLPLLDSNAKCRGVVRFSNKLGLNVKSRFSQLDFEMAKLFCGQLANALSRVYSDKLAPAPAGEVDNNGHDLLQLHQFVFSNLNRPTRALEVLLERARKMLKADIVFLNPSPAGYQGLGRFEEELAQLRYKVKLSSAQPSNPRPNGITSLVNNSPGGYVFVDLVQHPELNSEFLQAEKIQSVMGLALKTQGSDFGVLYLDYRRNFAPSFNEIRLARIIASLAALVLYIAQLTRHNGLTLDELQLIGTLNEQQKLLEQLQELISSQLEQPLNQTAHFAYNLLNQTMSRPEQELVWLAQNGKLFGGWIESLKQSIEIVRLNLSKPLPEATDVVAMLDDLLEELAERASEQGVALKCVTPGCLPLIQADPVYLQQILKGLLENALAFTPSGGEVIISYAIDKNWLRLDVKDTGKGISREERERVFELFYRGKPAAHKGVSLGAGLYFARKFARMHYGSIQLASYPDQGSFFRLELPLAIKSPVAIKEDEILTTEYHPPIFFSS